MRKSTLLLATAATLPATPAYAKPGDLVVIGEGVTLDPIVEGLLRYEAVDQDDIGRDADALTIGMQMGAELKAHGFSVLAEAEGTLALVNDFNDTIAGNNGYPGAEPYSIVADPETVELNRLQIGYATKDLSLTLGRQRIVLGNQRFVGNVGWRQNEQTFDAVRGTAKLGPVALDATYANSQRTIFGSEAGVRKALDGDHVFLNAGVKVAEIDVTGFAYLLDYADDEPLSLAMSSQTYGAVASGKIPFGKTLGLTFLASYARQQDYKGHAADYDADYINAELGATVAGFKLLGGYELLGSDNGIGFSTPMATLHKFNGFADVFLTTPGAGLEDWYGTVGYEFKGVKALPGLNASVTYHKFESDAGGLDYGDEWDATLGFKLAGYAVAAKYANYSADRWPASGDVEKLWLQIGFAY